MLSCLDGTQFQGLANASNLICLPVGLTTDLNLPETIDSSGIIHRFLARFVVIDSESEVLFDV